jgi:chromate transport protein ChrA
MEAWRSIATALWHRGITTFGGPPAHVAVFHRALVVSKDPPWIGEEEFLELYACAGALPGPTSSQLGYSISLWHGGIFGAIFFLITWIGPMAIVLSTVGWLYSLMLSTDARGSDYAPLMAEFGHVFNIVENGIIASAMGIIAVTFYTLSLKVMKNAFYAAITWVMMLCVASITWPYAYPIYIAAAATAGVAQEAARRVLLQYPQLAVALGWSVSEQTTAEREKKQKQKTRERENEMTYNDVDDEEEVLLPMFDEDGDEIEEMDAAIVKGEEEVEEEMDTEREQDKSNDAIRVSGPLWLHSSWAMHLTWLLPLLVLAAVLSCMLLHFLWPSFKLIAVMDSLLRIGSYGVGGGMAILPMLYDEFVVSGLLSERVYLLSVAMALSSPGPMNNVASFLAGAVLGPLGCVVGPLIFWPGMMLMTAVMPFWRQYRHITWVSSAFAAMNAAGLGFIAAAIFMLYQKVTVETPVTMTAIAFGGALLSIHTPVPVPLIIFLGGIVAIVSFTLSEAVQVILPAFWALL